MSAAPAPAIAAGPAAAGALYVGHVRHRRFAPRAHAFRRPLYMAYLDLDRLDEAFAAHGAFSARAFAPAWFRRADHIGDPREPLARTVRGLVERRTGRRPAGPVRTLTFLRTFGIGMTPASFHYAFRDDGALDALVVEVHNTPWRERHAYVLDAGGARAGETVERELAKDFHVSPFLGMDYTYRFRFGVPGERLTAGIENHGAAGLVFDATLELERRPLTRATLAQAMRRHPFMALEVLAGIYGHAFRLWRKGVPYHPHPRDRGRGTKGRAA